MNIKKELQEILKQIEENISYAHDDAGENGTDVVVLQDFDPRSEDSEDMEEQEHVEALGLTPVEYNGWYERLKQLTEIL